jgi:putative pyruvate formate lyase activating enzyme
MWLLARPEALTVWKKDRVKEGLSWYYSVMTHQRPSKYLLAKRIESEINLESTDKEKLWQEHSKLSSNFKSLHRQVVEGTLDLQEMPEPHVSFLDVKIALARNLLRRCRFCERRCHADRLSGQKGFCNLDSSSRVSTYFLHTGEEAPLIPSGTIFFTSCTFRCVFCQNHDISTNPLNGDLTTSEDLAKIMDYLAKENARNINFVGGEPTMHLHTILSSLKFLDANIPLLWNSNMYCSEETMTLLSEIMDIWLPDFKYGNDACARRLSKVENYFQIAARNHVRASENGDMIVRHLVLPNHMECCTKPVLKWLNENCPRALVNVMGQYRIEHLVARSPEQYTDISRIPSAKEMSEAFEYAKALGIEFESVS